VSAIFFKWPGLPGSELGILFGLHLGRYTRRVFLTRCM
jgi:hypothetical protein